MFYNFNIDMNEIKKLNQKISYFFKNISNCSLNKNVMYIIILHSFFKQMRNHKFTDEDIDNFIFLSCCIKNYEDITYHIESLKISNSNNKID